MTQIDQDRDLLLTNRMGNFTTASSWQKFSNLSISRKTALIPWISFGALLLIMSIGGAVLHHSLKSQLFKQVASQLAVTDIQYNLKIDQMGFGFRGQSNNSAIIQAIDLTASGQSISPELKQQIIRILKNEITTHQIEYATLVGKDKKIIANGNANRSGQIFDPQGLVSKVLQNSQQIKASQIVSWQELNNEKPPLPEGIATEDALIRYTATPVFASNNQKQAAGVLISGDIVNGKMTIPQNTVQALNDQRGYSAVYLHQPKGEFRLSTAWADLGKSQLPNVPLAKTKILDSAIQNLGSTVTTVAEIEGKKYAVAAKAIPDSSQQAVAVLVYGNPLNSMAGILQSSLLTQLVLAAALLILVLALSKLLSKAIAEPIQKLQLTAHDFAEGNMQTRAIVETTDEIGLLASTFNVLADSIQANEKQLKQEARSSQLLKEAVVQLGQVKETTEILQVAVETSRIALEVDRVVYYQVTENWQGTVAAESVREGLPTTLDLEVLDPHWSEEFSQQYQQPTVKAIAELHNAQLTEYEQQILELLAATAGMVAPVLQAERLRGLLIAHQFDTSRQWQASEIDFLAQIGIQLSIALEKAALLEQQQIAEQQERQARENLQRRALELLMEVDPVSRGDLTVRVQVQEDEIGTIGDSYNATIESLRKLVAQVQTAATLVSTTTSDKDTSIKELSSGAAEQTQAITDALQRIQGITQSITAVAQNAAAAEAAVLQATETVKAGDDAMNRTVEGFQGIRATVAETAKKVKRLGESSQKISKVVNVIGNFADQTNLLALNASIEAAHAGEEGRGFAVVADEVRSLARQSAEATAEIAALVAEIQSETNEVVAAMESGTEQVVEGTKLVDATRYSLIQIADVSNTINQLVEAIAAAAVEQSQDSEIVSQAMAQVATISDRTVTEASQVSESFQELLTVAQQLQDSVAKFKVS